MRRKQVHYKQELAGTAETSDESPEGTLDTREEGTKAATTEERLDDAEAVEEEDGLNSLKVRTAARKLRLELKKTE